MGNSGSKHIQELFDLTGRVAFVTGASRGLGKEIAIGLGEAGAKVTITARRKEWLMPAQQEITSSGIECLAVEGDVSNPDSVKTIVAKTLERWGKIDILVNNAGITWGAVPAEMPLDRWQSVMDTNAKGTLICCQQVGKEMIKQRKGSIINVSSTTGITGVDPKVMQAIGYQASKAAVAIMTKQLAIEWAPYNIRVNAIAPFFFPTRMTKPLIERSEEEIIRHTPMARIGREGEAKGTVVFLASDASSYVTGQIICIDGGTTAW
jgi:gluconate 5-dehydrogenase